MKLRADGSGWSGGKLKEHHLERLAVVYIRQSTLQQVVEHQESTRMQYGLTERAQSLGWSAERVLTIDEDQCKMKATSGSCQVLVRAKSALFGLLPIPQKVKARWGDRMGCEIASDLGSLDEPPDEACKSLFPLKITD